MKVGKRGKTRGVGFFAGMSPDDLDRLSHPELKGLVVKQREQIVELQRMMAAACDEIARLKDGPGRPNLKPSGMERGSEPAGSSSKQKRPRGKHTFLTLAQYAYAIAPYFAPGVSAHRLRSSLIGIRHPTA